MPTPDFSLPGGDSPEDLRDYLIKLQRDLNYLLTHLDDLNVSRLNARVIVSESITTDKLAASSITTDKLDAGSVTADKIEAGAVKTDKLEAGAVTTDKINAGAVTAEKITVAELSAITANLGTITAGLLQAVQIYGSYIATSNSYPRIELSSVGNLLAAYSAANKYISINPFSSNNVPSFGLWDGDALRGADHYILSNAYHIIGVGATPIHITSPSGAIFLNAGTYVDVGSWSKLRGTSSQTLQQVIDGLQSQINSLVTALSGKANVSHTHSVTIPDHNHGNPDNVNSGGGTFVVS